MGRATVRHALVDFLDGQVDGLTTIYSSIAYIAPGSAFTKGVPPGTGTAAIAAVHFPSSVEKRLTMGSAIGGPVLPPIGTGAQKMVTHQVNLLVRVHSRRRDANQAMDEADAIYDQLLAVLRSPAGHTLGTTGSPPPIWLAGEDQAGDLRMDADAMRADDNNVLWQFTNVTLTVQEIVQS